MNIGDAAVRQRIVVIEFESFRGLFCHIVTLSGRILLLENNPCRSSKCFTVCFGPTKSFAFANETPMSLRRAHTWRMKNLTCFGRHVRSDMGSEGCLLFGTKILRLKLAITPRIRDCVNERACEIVPHKGILICPYQDNEIYGQTKK